MDAAENKTKDRPKRKKAAVLLLLLAALLCAGAAGGVFAVKSLAYPVCRAEAGTEILASDFVKSGDSEAAFTADSPAFDSSVPGSYPVRVKSGLFTHRCTLIIEDTTPPAAQARSLTLPLGQTCAPEDFVADVQDAGPVTAAFVQEPELDRTGSFPVDILLTDQAGNTALLQAELTLTDDREPPRILGAQDLDVYQGATVSYRQGIELSDDSGGEVSLSVDSSAVDIDSPGTYPVLYTAQDPSGNRSAVYVHITVHPWTVDQEELDRLAEEALDSVLTEGMSGLDKVNAIYGYITTNVRYGDYPDSTDWARAAYVGLKNHQGDCYVFASVAKLLLTKAGITNMDISKSTHYGDHYWNLIDLGDGWYHFDTTPHSGSPRIVMWTDEQLMYYSKQNFNTHDYDHSQYPEIN